MMPPLRGREVDSMSGNVGGEVEEKAQVRREYVAWEGRTKYYLSVSDDGAVAEETVYPLAGYGNNFGTGWKIDLTSKRKYAVVTKYAWNATYATRGHGLTDAWTEGKTTIPKEKARELINEILSMDIENETQDVVNAAKKVIRFVNNALGEDE